LFDLSVYFVPLWLGNMIDKSREEMKMSVCADGRFSANRQEDITD